MQRFYFGLVLSCFLLIVKADYPSCIQCDSSETDMCALSPDRILAKSCSKEDSKCYVRIVDGKTIRGCTSDLDQKTINNCNGDCVICDYSQGCNGEIFPKHRIQCLQCKGSLNSTCATETFVSPSACPTYKLGDTCMIRKSVTSDEFIRGCLSSYEDKCKNIKECYICDGQGCNYVKVDDPAIPLAKDSAPWVMANTILIFILSILLLQN